MLQNYWFMQDGARPHCTVDILATFRDWIVALDTLAFTGHGVERPLYSPELNLCDYFLWGYLKNRIFKYALATLQDLHIVISRGNCVVKNDVLQKVIMKLSSRLYTLIPAEGKHFETLLY